MEERRPPERRPVTVAERWVLGLKTQSKLDAQQIRNEPNPRSRTRPPVASTHSSHRPNSTSPSLLSLETDRQTSTSINTTSRGSNNPSNLPQYRASNPIPSANRNNNSRSHNSLPVNGTGPNTPSRHREQQERVYTEPKYDAEFDRGNSSARVGNGNGSRGLFNPDSNGKPSNHSNAEPSKRKEREDQKRVRSKREIIEPVDLGVGKGSTSKESLESEESDRPGSRSSKEGRHRRRKEGEREGKVRREGELGVGEGLNATLVSEPSTTTPTIAHLNSSRQLFDPRRDDPVRFTHGGPAIRKSVAPSIVSSFASSAISVNSVASVELRNDLTEEGIGRADQNGFVAGLRKAYREITDLETKLQEEHKAAFVAATREEEAAQGLRAAGVGKKYDDDYWVKLATGHKQLADAHYSFLQMALDPRLPPSLHSLAQKYNIPTRLWQTAFHQLLERMRHAITSPSTANINSTGVESVNVLEHLIEFIQYAYGHYSQLFEDPSVAIFRSAWIEQLGDLARYRMAVAGLASRVSAQQLLKANGNLFLPEVNFEREVRGIDAASIGDAALGDWEVEEQESWKVMARDWYSQGVTETPGSGRLQHHLALLSKGDELRGLYHYSKSLCASHPYLSARESILPLFEDEQQARRTQPDVTKAELFVHLHGMLFTKIALDDFEESLERFLERLKEEACLIKRAKEIGELESFGDKEWFMIAVINIAAMLQYGSDDGVLKKHVTKETESSKSEIRAERNGAPTVKGRTPQAIMVKSSGLSRSEEGEKVKPLLETKEEDPLVFRLAQRLSFSILDILLENPYRIVGGTEILNPYIVLLFTFLSHMAQHPAGLRHLERAVPWYRLVAFLNTIPSDVEVKMEVSSKLLGNPLPEDWCIRGMDWTGKSLFSRSYWKPKLSGSKREESFMPPIGPNSRVLESEMEALRLELDTIDENFDLLAGIESPSQELAKERWKRISINSAWLARNVPGLDFDSLAVGSSPKFSILGHLETKLRRWKKEEEDAVEVERLWKVSQWSRDVEEVEMEESEDESEDEEDLNDSPAIRELKTRRRELKAVIKEARLATRAVKPISGKKSNRYNSRQTAFKVFAGYTVLVFDTNILLTSMKLFKKLIEMEKWTIVVPLAVITELDGLRKNSTPLGIAAEAAIIYLESTIQTKSRYLKVQTSRGNYLKDLQIRSENIDFAGELNSVETFSHDFAKNMDDIILKAVTWQKDHFTSRLAIVNPKADRNLISAEMAKVVLISFDANLRVKAASRGLDATDAKGMNSLLAGLDKDG